MYDIDRTKSKSFGNRRLVSKVLFPKNRVCNLVVSEDPKMSYNDMYIDLHGHINHAPPPQVS